MPLSQKLEKLYNDQITLEFTAAYQYLAMSGWYETKGLPGFAQWMRLQSDEEWAHGMKFYRFLLDRDGHLQLGQIPAPTKGYDTPLEVFEAALENERRVSKSINALYAAAQEEHDFASVPLLDWFVNEQVEEEATIQQVIDDLKRTEGSGQALLMLDRELGARKPDAE